MEPIRCILTFVLLQLCNVDGKAANEMNFKHMKFIDDVELDRLRQKNEVSAVYYYKKDIPRLKGFLKELDKSAEYLKLYGVEVGFFDCGNIHESKEPKCNEHNAEFHIYTYRGNHILLELGLETMFDVNSVMSNILQLVLIHDVPILQSQEERTEYENRFKGQKDILFTYQKAIGTFEHRIFMEVAFAYQDKFKFAVCTNKQAVEDLKDHTFSTIEKSAIWLLRCKDWKHKELKCPHFKYNQKHDLATLASFVKTLTYPRVFRMPSDGKDVPYYQDKGMPVMYVLYDKDSENIALSAAVDTSEAFLNILGVVAVDVDKMGKDGMRDMDYHGNFPAVAFHTKDMEKPIFMTAQWSLERIHGFLIENMNQRHYPPQPDGESDMGPGPDHIVTSGDVEDDEDYQDEAQSFSDEEIEEVETQDDAVAEAVYQSRRKPPQVELIDALTDKTFPKTIKNKDLVFVLFYLPFDDKSIAFLYSYADASKEIENDPARPLTRVNCHDWTDVCGNEMIITYPTVRIYRNGKVLNDYRGLLDSKAVVTTLKLLNQTNPLNLEDTSSIMNLMNGVLPSGEPVITETVVMALLDKSHDTEMKVFKTVSGQLEDVMTFAYNNDGAANKIPDFKFKVPSIVVLRRSDILKPHVVYTGKMEVDDLKEFIQKASIPSMPELTVEWFPTLYRQQKPFVILFLDSHQESSRVKRVMEDVVISAKFPSLQFVWMKAEPMTTGRAVLNEYDKENQIPAISYIDLKSGIVYNNKDEYHEEKKVSKWLTDIIEEKIKPSKILEQGDWKPKKKGYDFLSMIDKEKELKKRKRRNGRSEEERNVELHGIGFDKDGKEVDMSEMLEEKSPKVNVKDDNVEDEIREELLALHQTRLYKSGGGRRHKDHSADGRVVSPKPNDRSHESAGNTASQGVKSSEDHKLKHTEL